VLIVPLCLLFALVGVRLNGGDNNVFTQIAFIVLIGLACKNAILIVEFAKTKNQEENLPPASRAGGVSVATPADFDDLNGLHRRSLAAGLIAGSRCGNAACHGNRDLCGHDWSDHLRSLPYANFLCVGE
jgi:AcrB/AcrD/AcrF family